MRIRKWKKRQIISHNLFALATNRQNLFGINYMFNPRWSSLAGKITRLPLPDVVHAKSAFCRICNNFLQHIGSSIEEMVASMKLVCATRWWWEHTRNYFHNNARTRWRAGEGSARVGRTNNKKEKMRQHMTFRETGMYVVEAQLSTGKC